MAVGSVLTGPELLGYGATFSQHLMGIRSMLSPLLETLLPKCFRVCLEPAPFLPAACDTSWPQKSGPASANSSRDCWSPPAKGDLAVHKKDPVPAPTEPAVWRQCWKVLNRRTSCRREEQTVGLGGWQRWGDLKQLSNEIGGHRRLSSE